MEQKGFFGSLFDFSVTSLITSRLVSVMDVLAIICIGIFALFLIDAGFTRGTAIGVLVILEVLIVMFRIHEHVSVKTT